LGYPWLSLAIRKFTTATGFKLPIWPGVGGKFFIVVANVLVVAIVLWLRGNKDKKLSAGIFWLKLSRFALPLLFVVVLPMFTALFALVPSNTRKCWQKTLGNSRTHSAKYQSCANGNWTASNKLHTIVQSGFRCVAPPETSTWNYGPKHQLHILIRSQHLPQIRFLKG
jgi:hypothetical protein